MRPSPLDELPSSPRPPPSACDATPRSATSTTPHRNAQTLPPSATLPPASPHEPAPLRIATASRGGGGADVASALNHSPSGPSASTTAVPTSPSPIAMPPTIAHLRSRYQTPARTQPDADENPSTTPPATAPLNGYPEERYEPPAASHAIGQDPSYLFQYIHPGTPRVLADGGPEGSRAIPPVRAW